MRTILALNCFLLVSLFALAAVAQERERVATLRFDIGEATLTEEHRAQLDDLKRRYPPAAWTYSFEGDHDPLPFEDITPNASLRVNERLAETRWQSVAKYLGVPALGVVRVTGSTEARVYVQPRAATEEPAVLLAALQDSLAALRRRLDDQSRLIDQLRRKSAETRPETILAVARFEELHVRVDKWLDRRWYESQGGFELGILRVQPERPRHRRSGATLAIGSGTPAYHALDISTRFDLFRVGVERIGITPALRWYDWNMRVHYGDDREALTNFLNRSDPVYLIGLDLDATPWPGGLVRLKYAGAGTRVHAADRALISYDQYDLRFDQLLHRDPSRRPNWWLELQAVYDERYDRSLCYYGGWIAHGWPMLLGTFSVRLGFVEELDAFLAARVGREDPISTISIGFVWDRQSRFGN